MIKLKTPKFVKELYEFIIIAQYVRVGLTWGDMESYTFMGEPYGYDRVEKRLERMEKKYKSLGYKLVSRKDWVGAGGYGKPYEHLLYQPID